jgi:hypothetical protein
MGCNRFGERHVAYGFAGSHTRDGSKLRRFVDRPLPFRPRWANAPSLQRSEVPMMNCNTNAESADPRAMSPSPGDVRWHALSACSEAAGQGNLASCVSGGSRAPQRERLRNRLLPFCYPTAGYGAGQGGTVRHRAVVNPNKMGLFLTVRYWRGRDQANYKTAALPLS